ncbi:aryl-sulfate sulfotransferase [Peptoniphilus equinus]|uniref:Aryl-sulfate sulfotransferase n=1 Tax=Peptoniphilus equinus TaxID=3016343 RepID=A0ABY7QRF4_9FIRM|nr:aryl-sulfate sulfotransferase [Peptoniphilus equinus]WBW49370.1 aryl-sulfate sulfotransferase [Peptoniphilus equinus]
MEKLKTSKAGIYITLVGICLFALCGCTGQLSIEDKAIAVHQLDVPAIKDMANPVDKGKEIAATLDQLKQDSAYNFPDILAVSDPYAFNTTGLYVYFNTKSPVKVSETISVPDSEIDDFERALQGKGGYRTEHEYLLTGLVPGKNNTITLTITEKSGKTKAVRFDYAASDIKSTTYKGLKVQKGNSEEKPIDGLFMLPTGVEEGAGEYSLLIDDDGVIRGELQSNFVNVKFKDGCLYTTVDDENGIAKINRLGQTEHLYDFGNYAIHHDFTMTDDSLYALTTDKEVLWKENRVYNSVIKIDLRDDTVTELVDFKDLLPDLYEKATGIVNHPVLNNSGRLDVIHPNSIDYVDGSLIISSRETSTIMKIDVSGKTPKIEYLLSEPSVWEDIGNYSSYLYKKEGNFKPHAGQHTVYVARDKKLPATSYYLYMFDNNSAIMESRRNFSWQGFDDVVQVPPVINKDTTLPKGTSSYYYKYLVDEDAKTYRLEKKIALPFSFFQGSVMESGGHIIYGSSFRGAFGEMDTDGNVINGFMLKENSHPYRAGKFDFNGYWFVEK